MNKDLLITILKVIAYIISCLLSYLGGTVMAAN